MQHRACKEVSKCKGINRGRQSGGPEVEVVNGALLIPHVDVEREQIDRRKRSPTKDFEERRQTVPSQVGLGRG